ncbi:hypothetical protein M9H77_27358 [Catharanthus roseus]|uniref:Uncharacterized protein n=1 Tax=Catharanthus roseus TaxID=4058 RepID=A0ACC0AE65_CATRO|nr:hypothetical protein M9H77_27358 [Catharanthus roseus]
MKLIHCLNWGYYSLFYYVLKFSICYILGENLDFDNLFPPEILCPVFYPVDCSCLEDRILNYKEHFSKSSNAELDKNWIDMFVSKFSANIYSSHKHLVLYRFLYILQEYENKAIYILAIYRNCMIFNSFLIYKHCCWYPTISADGLKIL